MKTLLAACILVAFSMPALSAPQMRIKAVDKYNEKIKKGEDDVNRLAEDDESGINDKRQKAEAEQRSSEAQKKENIEWREGVIKTEQGRKEGLKTLLKGALVERQEKTKELVSNPSKAAMSDYKKSERKVEILTKKFNEKNLEIYKLNIANDRDRDPENWRSTSTHVPPKPYVPPGMSIKGPVNMNRHTEPVSRSTESKRGESKRGESTAEESKPNPRLKGAVDDYTGDVNKHRQEQEKFDAYVEKYRKVLDEYRENPDPDRRKILEEAKRKILAEKERLEEQKGDLMERKKELTKACSDQNSHAMYASVSSVDISSSNAGVSRDIVRDIARATARDAASNVARTAATDAAREAAAGAAKQAAKDAAKQSAKESSKAAAKDSSKHASKGAASSAAHSAAKPMPGH